MDGGGVDWRLRGLGGLGTGVGRDPDHPGDWAQAMTSAVVMASRLAAPPTTMLAWQPAPDSLLKKIALSILAGNVIINQRFPFRFKICMFRQQLQFRLIES